MTARLLLVLLSVFSPLTTHTYVIARGASSGVTPPQKRGTLPTVWLYTSVACDYDGAIVLPHFLEHYLTNLKIDPRRLLVVVNHNPHNPDMEQVRKERPGHSGSLMR